MEKIVSPGVFTNEKDQSYLAQGISEIGGAFIGPFLKGPAFVPTKVTSPNDSINKFGNTYDKFYTPYAVQEYLKNAGTAYVVRVLWDEGYTKNNSEILPITLGNYAAGAYASGAFNLNVSSSFAVDSNFYLTGPDSTVYTFTVKEDADDWTDVSPQFYFTSASTSTSSSAHLAAKITGSFNFVGLNMTYDATNSLFSFTASEMGTEGNSIVFQTGSHSVTLSGGVAATEDTVVALLAPTTQTVTSMSLDSGTKTELLLTITDSNPVYGTTTYTASLRAEDSNYIGKIFGTNPRGGKSAYVYKIFDNAISASTETVSSKNTNVTLDFEYGVGDQYKKAETPWIKSQKFGSDVYNLFKFISLSDGTLSNKEVKVGIYNVKEPGTITGTDYGEFSVVIREYDDTDSSPKVLETYVNINLDPTSVNYIANVIGDRYASFNSDGKLTYVGDYPNKSKYVRVEMQSAISDGILTPSAVPFGFAAVKTPFKGATIPTASFKEDQIIDGETSTKAFYGFDFSKADSLQYLAPLPEDPTVGNNPTFSLDDYVNFSSGSSTLQFLIPFQGGFDGADPAQTISTGENISATDVMGFDCSSATATGTTVYRKALDTISNPDEIDINAIFTPGILQNQHSSVTNYAKNICENRGDCFYPIDLVKKGTSVANAVSAVSGLNSNYTATFYPWLKIKDSNTNRFVWVPPTTLIAGAIAYSDSVSYPWYAFAGLNRGGLPSALDIETRLTRAERDTLYEAKINPIATFPGQGIAVWGQKTLQALPSALDRINVRRLLIKVKKYIASTTRYLLFEQNTPSTRNKFLNMVNPYLENIQQNQGITSFKVVMDETNNGPDVVDRNQMYGEIYLQPSKAAEFIVIDFNITRTGASFEE